jgi:WW domain
VIADFDEESLDPFAPVTDDLLDEVLGFSDLQLYERAANLWDSMESENISNCEQEFEKSPHSVQPSLPTSNNTELPSSDNPLPALTLPNETIGNPDTSLPSFPSSTTLLLREPKIVLCRLKSTDPILLKLKNKKLILKTLGHPNPKSKKVSKTKQRKSSSRNNKRRKKTKVIMNDGYGSFSPLKVTTKSKRDSLLSELFDIDSCPPLISIPFHVQQQLNLPSPTYNQIEPYDSSTPVITVSNMSISNERIPINPGPTVTRILPPPITTKSFESQTVTCILPTTTETNLSRAALISVNLKTIKKNPGRNERKQIRERKAMLVKAHQTVKQNLSSCMRITIPQQQLLISQPSSFPPKQRTIKPVGRSGIWDRHHSRKTGREYYYNVATKESRWEKPTDWVDFTT